jgi:hypothetical protein
LLQLQSDFYRQPRGFERFRTYLATMSNPETGDLKLPLVAMNPMAKDHLLPFLANLLALDADSVAAEAAEAAAAQIATHAGTFQVTTVVSDDAQGGWTHRFSNDFAHRCGEQALYKRGWITAVLWTGSSYTVDLIRQEVLASIYRWAYLHQHGTATTLADLLTQEGFVMRRAGATEPILEHDDLEYTREVLAAYLHCNDQPTLIAALYGDGAARELGYPPLGLSAHAGLAVALADSAPDQA